jgi:hypothetical protein
MPPARGQAELAAGPLARGHPRVWAEQALLGAVLLDPEGEQQMLDLVRSEDMRRPWNGQVLEAMQRVRARGGLPGPVAVYRELHNDPDLPRGVARNAVPVAELMEAAPRAGHAPAYAAMVVEGGIRERLQLMGARVLQASGTGSIEAVHRQAFHGARDLEACRCRWAALPERVRMTASGDAPAGPAGKTLGLPASSRDGGTARPEGTDAQAAGERALRDLAAAPDRLTLVGQWLRPEHFGSARHGELYALMREMHRGGRPVDPVTVAWEAARHGLRVEPERLEGGMAPFAVASAREVHRHGLLAQAAQTGRAIQADTADLGCRPRQMMELAGQRLRALEAQLETALQRGAVTRIPQTAEKAPCSQPRQTEREAV